MLFRYTLPNGEDFSASRSRDDLQLLVLTLPRDQDVYVSYCEPRTRQVIKARQRESIIPLDMDNYSARIYIWRGR